MRRGPFVRIVAVAGGLATLTACTCNGCPPTKSDPYYDDSHTTPTTAPGTGDTSDTAALPASSRRRGSCPP